MEAWQKLSTPGEAHARMEPMIGEFDAKVTIWMDPSQPPMEAAGVMKNFWILGGRFMQNEYKGEAMGQPFEGWGLFGHNNAANEYEGLWVDSMSTQMQTDKGQYDASTNSWTMRGVMTGPDGSDVHRRTLVKIESNDRHVMEMFHAGADGREAKSMEIVYTRRK